MEQRKRVLTARGLLITLCIIALLLFLDKCGFINLPFGENKTVTKYVPIKEIVKEQAKDEKINKRNDDSFHLVIQKEQKLKAEWKLKYEDLMTDYLNAENDFNIALREKIPDTCLPYQRKLTEYYNGIILKNANKDKAAGNTIASLERLNLTKDNFIDEKNRQLAKQKSNLDSCIATGKALEKLKAKREINIGASTMAQYAGNFNPQFGVILGYRNKKGLEFNVGIYTNKVATITFKTPLVRF